MHGFKLLKVLPVFILLLLITGGADNKAQVSKNIMKAYSGKGLHTIILTNNNKQWNGQYYTAMLNLKKKYPSKKYHIKVYDKEEKPDLIHYLNVKKYPALIVIKDDKTLSVISGPNKWKLIYNKLAHVITPS